MHSLPIRIGLYSIAILTWCLLFGCDSTSGPKPQPLPHAREIVMVDIPGGTFIMGTNDRYVGVTQKPAHNVTVSPFSMQETEVTQGQYLSIIGGGNPSWFHLSGIDSPENPIERVSWFDAVLFCNKLSKIKNKDTVYSYTSKTMYRDTSAYYSFDTAYHCNAFADLQIDYAKKGYRLPTEAEWEYACRGGTSTEYWWGRLDTDMDKNSWYQGNSNDRTHPVATKPKNPFGLYDISGNVNEWCNDWFGWYDSLPKINPTGPDSADNQRVIRGGSWYEGNNGELHSYFRNDETPGSYAYYIGFRVVLPK